MKILSIRPSRTWQQANPPAPPVGNTAPVAINATYNATEGGTANVNLAATDVEGGGLTYTVLTQPTKGTLSGTAPSLIYTPTAGQYGVDSFTFKANDGMADSNVATVTVNVSGGAYASSVTQHGITWTFDQPYQVGQYCNGDWWVVGPIVLTGPVSEIITEPTKNITGAINGTMINPIIRYPGNHGFDFRIQKAYYAQYHDYLPALNDGLKMPLAVDANSSVLSCKSEANVVVGTQLSDMACLTVVGSPPPAGSFRPTFHVSANKASTYNKSQIDYTKLQKLPLVAQAARPINELRVSRSMFELNDRYQSVYTVAKNNCPFNGTAYGRDTTTGFAIVGLELNLNYTEAEKEKMAIGMIQQGLDIYGGLLQGQHFWGGYAIGGFMGGRKLPVAMAGLLLNDSAILEWIDPVAHPQRFAEDTHFYVTQAEIDTPRLPDNDPSRFRTPFPQDTLGMPEWNSDGPYPPERSSGYNWNLSYRTLCGSAYLGEALVARLSGLKQAWGNDAFFDYYDVYYRIESPQASNSANEIRLFFKSMWDAYRSTPEDPYPSPTSAAWRLDFDVVNDQPPVPNPAAYTTAFQTPLPITLTATELNNKPLYYSVITKPTKGTIAYSGYLHSPNIIYTPKTGAVGTDSFTFRATSYTRSSTNVTVTIEIAPAA